MLKYLLTMIILLHVTQLHAAGNYKRIVSINLCTDQLLFSLEDKANIISVSFLSHDINYSPYAFEMKDIPGNQAMVEELIPMKADLILAGDYTDSHTLHFLKQLGYNVVKIKIPWNMQEIESTIVELGKILGRENRAKKIIENMKYRQDAVHDKLKGTDKPTAIILAPNGFTHGRDTMKGDLLETAYFENLAASAGIDGSGNINIETLLSAQPDYIIIEDNENQRNSMAQRLLKHPALTRGLPNSKHIHINPNLWTCGGPNIMDALDILAEAHP